MFLTFPVGWNPAQNAAVLQRYTPTQVMENTSSFIDALYLHINGKVATLNPTIVSTQDKRTREEMMLDILGVEYLRTLDTCGFYETLPRQFAQAVTIEPPIANDINVDANGDVIITFSTTEDLLDKADLDASQRPYEHYWTRNIYCIWHYDPDSCLRNYFREVEGNYLLTEVRRLIEEDPGSQYNLFNHPALEEFWNAEEQFVSSVIRGTEPNPFHELGVEAVFHATVFMKIGIPDPRNFIYAYSPANQLARSLQDRQHCHRYPNHCPLVQ